MQTRTLDGRWEVRQSGGTDSHWHDATVPGGVYGDLLAAGEIPDPYEADNELGVQWVGETDWEYRRSLTVEDELLDQDRIVLECDGLDTVATVLVNGAVVGTSENMHRAYAFDVADALVAGENEIRVRFRSLVEYARERAAEYPYEVPALRYPVDQPHRNFIRKAQCHFGWDWGPCLPTMGIWRSIRLVAHSDPRIAHVNPHQHHDDETVDLDVRVGLDVPSAGEYTISASIVGTDAATARTCGLDAGSDSHGEASTDGETSEIELSLTVENPDLWWPAGHGDQPLYDLDVSVEGEAGTHEATERLGFREVELVREPDDTNSSAPPDAEGGESFFLRVNGEAVFMRGANWIPTDALYRNATAERYDELLSDAVAANMNTIRVWGGGYYERDEFYDRCDEFGVLVWQDFMFACAQYPGDDAFVDSVEAEARYQVRRLSAHPSLALWCGNNELEVGVESWFAGHEHSDAFEADYDRLFRGVLAEVVATEDPTQPYWSASPSSGPDRVDPENESRGDIHYWGVWHEGKPFSAFLDTQPRFVSEFGYQSFPSVESLDGVVPEGQHNPTAPVMEHHQRNPGGNARILSRMADHFRMPWNFADFTYLSQIQQGLAIRTAVEHWRRSKPRCMGALFWQLHDLWPCASWSSIEYGGRWKALHHMARRFYEPVHVSLVERDGGNESDEPEKLDVWVTSDETHPLSGSVRLDAHTLRGEHPFEERFGAALDAGESACIGSVDIHDALDGTPRSEVLFSARPDGLGGSFPAFRVLEPYKRLSLPDTDLDVSVSENAVTVSAPEAALFVKLRVEDDTTHDSIRFSDNYFHLVPGESREIEYETVGGDEETDHERPPVDTLATALSTTHLAETY